MRWHSHSKVKADLGKVWWIYTMNQHSFIPVNRIMRLSKSWKK